jgi:hypothetical protein
LCLLPALFFGGEMKVCAGVAGNYNNVNGNVYVGMGEKNTSVKGCLLVCSAHERLTSVPALLAAPQALDQRLGSSLFLFQPLSEKPVVVWAVDGPASKARIAETGGALHDVMRKHLEGDDVCAVLVGEHWATEADRASRFLANELSSEVVVKAAKGVGFAVSVFDDELAAEFLDEIAAPRGAVRFASAVDLAPDASVAAGKSLRKFLKGLLGDSSWRPKMVYFAVVYVNGDASSRSWAGWARSAVKWLRDRVIGRSEGEKL